jgi:hypothetical protein
VRSTRRYADEWPTVCHPGAFKPGPGISDRIWTKKEIWRGAIRNHVQLVGGFEVTLCDRPSVLIPAPFRLDQQCAGQTMLGVHRPIPRDQSLEQPASKAAMQIQEMAVPLGPQLPRKLAEALAGIQTDHSAQVGIMAEQRSVHPLGEHGNTGRWVSPADGAEQRSGEENIADRAETYG